MNFAIGFVIGFLAGLLLTITVYECRLRQLRRRNRDRTAALLCEVFNRQAERPVLVWVTDGPAVNEESGPVSGIDIYLN